MIVIIGGGISGLALAHDLAARGLPFQLLEATDRVGGVMRSGRIDGHLLEWGPQRARLTGELVRLIDELDLRDELITAPPDLPLYVFARGALRRVPFSAPAFLTSDLLTASGRLRMLLEPFTAAARNDETVASFFTRKLGREAYENLAGPLYGGLYASDPHDMLVGLSLAHVLRQFGIGRSLLLRLLRRGGSVAAPDACSFRDGLQTLPRALHARHVEHVHLNTPVRAIESDGAAYAVITDGGRVRATDVVIATPAAAAARMLKGIDPRSAAAIEALRYNPLAVVHLLADTGLRGLGYQVALSEPLVTRGVTWNDSLFDRTGVYTAYLGGARNAWIVNEDPDRIAAVAVAEFRAVTGCAASVLSVELERMPAWDRSWSHLAGVSLPPRVHVHANWMERPGIPGRLDGARRLGGELERLAS